MLKIIMLFILAIILLCIVGVGVIFVNKGLFFRPAPQGLCQAALSDTPNWVSSLVAPDNAHYVKPLGLVDIAQLSACLKKGGLKSKLFQKGTHYHGYRRTKMLGFTDWFCISEKGEVTSSATLGYSDMGVNRAWVEQMRACLKPSS